MKLLRWGEKGAERPGMLDSAGKARDLSGIVSDIDGTTVTPEGLAKLRAIDASSLPEVPAGARLGPCIGNVGKFVCVGLNSADHAAESNLPGPRERGMFMKAARCTVGAHGPIGT